jgi:hypothetical protein
MDPLSKSDVARADKIKEAEKKAADMRAAQAKENEKRSVDAWAIADRLLWVQRAKDAGHVVELVGSPDGSVAVRDVTTGDPAETVLGPGGTALTAGPVGL